MCPKKDWSDYSVEHRVGTIKQSHKNTFKTGDFFILYISLHVSS